MLKCVQARESTGAMRSPCSTGLLIAFRLSRLCSLGRITNVYQCSNQVSGITWRAYALALINPLGAAYRAHGSRISHINRYWQAGSAAAAWVTRPCKVRGSSLVLGLPDSEEGRFGSRSGGWLEPQP